MRTYPTDMLLQKCVLVSATLVIVQHIRKCLNVHQKE